MQSADDAFLKSHRSFQRAQAQPARYVLEGLKLHAPRFVYHPRAGSSTRFVMNELPTPPERPKVLDLGTGSGALGLWMKTIRPHANVWMSDVDAAAVDAARTNAERNGLDVTVRRGDLFDVRGLPTDFDWLIFNYPFVARAREQRGEHISCDPEGRLAHRFLGRVRKHLRPGGRAFITWSDRAVGPLDGLAKEHELKPKCLARHDTRTLQRQLWQLSA